MTKSGAETARQLGLHVNTVRAALNRSKGLCPVYQKSVMPGRVYCKRCAKTIRERMSHKRAERRKKGLCAECDKPYELPSKTFCAVHRIAAIDRNARYAAKVKRGSPHAGIPNGQQRLKHIKQHYGEAGIFVWQRDKATCVICATPYSQKAIHIHHVDGDNTRSTVENMVCLCFRCHRLAHLFIEHPSPLAFITWIRATYPLIRV